MTKPFNFKISYILCLSLGLGIFSLGLTACSNAALSVDKAAQTSTAQDLSGETQGQQANFVKTTSQRDYLKPGAAIRFSHDLKSQLEVGEIGQFTLTAKNEYNAGDMKINMNAGKGLQLLSASESASFSLRDKTAHTMNVSFSTLNKGRHYINVSAIVTIDGRVTRRNYAVGVQVGAPQAKARPENLHINQDTGVAYIVMPAQETINGVPVEPNP